ncbi:regulator of G-protein signaling 1-like [Rhinatrema bivittatum]|uniref:regulator of G-protein signaling 1-like n=1 Tax=Rhinatrema bivittatum TaxID=194408 RepID=UPI00112C66CC|nr:regulator of G-protein signaling 1-like [Rhinatrema bivittatum]XP_029474512.1 regulator of G-protein signaling 1-like [Rhinatrema bivittatum]
MPRIFFHHANPTNLKEMDCKPEEDPSDKKKPKSFGTDLKSYLKSMLPHLPHLESGIKSSASKHNKLSPEEVAEWSLSLEKLLACQTGQAAFRLFLKSEFSEENIEFWLACEDYKKTKLPDNLYSKAEMIYQQFIHPDAAKQVNIDFHTRKNITSQVLQPTLTSFDEAQKTVYLLMEKDSYPRFLKSEAYLNLLNKCQASNHKG